MKLCGTRQATIVLGTFPLSSLGLPRGQVPFWPQNEAVTEARSMDTDE